MAGSAKTPADQVEEILKLVENAMDVLRQVVWALESLRARLDEETKDGGP